MYLISIVQIQVYCTYIYMYAYMYTMGHVIIYLDDDMIQYSSFSDCWKQCLFLFCI